MAASKTQIMGWFREAEAAGATHMLVVCDTFEYEDYDVPVMPGEDVTERIEYYRGQSMQRVMEVYRIDKGWHPQSSGLVWNV